LAEDRFDVVFGQQMSPLGYKPLIMLIMRGGVLVTRLNDPYYKEKEMDGQRDRNISQDESRVCY